MVQAEPTPTYYYGTGKRKTSIARVRLYLDDGGPILVNGKPMDEFFNWAPWQKTINEAFRISDTVNKFRVVVKSLVAALTPRQKPSATALPGRW